MKKVNKIKPKKKVCKGTRIDVSRSACADTNSLSKHIIMSAMCKRKQQNEIKKPKCKPMFEMKLGSKNLNILNQDDVHHNVTSILAQKRKKTTENVSPEMLQKLHGKSCRCCICMSAKEQRTYSAPFRNMVKSICSHFSNTKSCTCGSERCADMCERNR